MKAILHRIKFSPVTFMIKMFTLLVPLTIHWGCSGEKVAGTSTTTGNTITGIAATAEGGPAGAAKVTLRNADYLPESLGFADSPENSITVEHTDSSGWYQFTDIDSGDYLIEIYDESQGVSGLLTVSLETSDSVHLDTALLASPVTLSGHIDVSDATTPEEVWVGVEGTDHFTQLDTSGSFKLDELPHGNRQLVVLQDQSDVHHAVHIDGIHLEGDEPMILDSIQLPEQDTPQTVDAHACVDFSHLNVLRNGQHSDRAPVKAAKRLVTVLLSTPPRLVFMDFCRGLWQGVRDLPNEALHLRALFSFTAQFHLLIPQDSLVISINTESDVQEQIHYNGDVLTGDRDHDRVYTFFHGDSSIMVYSSIQNFLNASPDSTIAIAVTPLKISSRGEYLFFYTVGDAAGIHRYNLNTGATEHFNAATDFEGDLVGMQAVGAEEVWLLSSLNRLHLYVGTSDRAQRILQIESSLHFRGLAN